MPNRSRTWATGRSCVILADRLITRILVPALEKVGFHVQARAPEAGHSHSLKWDAPSVVLFSHAPGLPPLSLVVSTASHAHPAVPVVVLGSTTSVDVAVEVMRAGATDYVPGPLDTASLLARIRRLLEGARSAETAPSSGANMELHGLIGHSAELERVFATIESVSRYKTNVLLLGESGTGKELVARALHTKGQRRQHLFVPINCATLGRELLENELFGHERGAFTGANDKKKGLLELADKGTIFFDEIAEMDPTTQAKLLRVLERNEFRRVGGTEKVKIDLSVIAATNKSLPDLIAAGTFREDLYYRLKVVTVVLPPLRDRKEDIPALIDAFVGDFNRRNGDKIKGVAPQLLRRFMAYDWPGNVRELKHAVESAAVLALGETIELDGLEAPLPPRRREGARNVGSSPDEIRVPADMPLADVERRIIIAHVERAATKDAAARSLGIGLRTLYAKLKQYERQS